MSNETNCPNCGAPIALGKSKCPYCDTPYQEKNNSIVINPGFYSHFDVFRNGFSIKAEPGSPIEIEFLTLNEQRELYGLPPIINRREENQR